MRPDRPPKFLTNPQEWNDGSGRGRRDDVSFLVALLDRLQANRIYLTGFSNGAGMAFRLAAEHAGRIAALAPVAGHCWLAEPRPSRTVPTYYLVGDADPLVPIAGGEVRTPWGRVETRPPLAQTLSRWGRAIDREWGTAEFRVDVVLELGHHWPGGAGLLGERLGGPTTSNVNATPKIWRFFKGVEV